MDAPDSSAFTWTPREGYPHRIDFIAVAEEVVVVSNIGLVGDTMSGTGDISRPPPPPTAAGGGGDSSRFSRLGRSGTGGSRVACEKLWSPPPPPVAGLGSADRGSRWYLAWAREKAIAACCCSCSPSLSLSPRCSSSRGSGGGGGKLCLLGTTLLLLPPSLWLVCWCPCG